MGISNTSFKPGVSGNPNGKPKGALNKVTRDVKYVIQYILDNLKDEDIRDLLNTLKKKNPTALLNFIGKIAPNDFTLKGDGTINVNINNEDDLCNNKD